MTPEELHPFHVKESHMAEGITADYVWYESSMIRNAMEASLHRFDKVVSVMETRHKEHIKMLQDVMKENRDLKARIKDDAVSIVMNVGKNLKGAKPRKKK
jgi:predicted patatin/cPLA2 family phospholipase